MKQLATRKKQLTTRNFISNMQNKCTARKSTLQLVKRNSQLVIFFLKSQLTTRNSLLATRKL